MKIFYMPDRVRSESGFGKGPLSGSDQTFDAYPDPACHFDADPDPDPTITFTLMRMRIRILAFK